MSFDECFDHAEATTQKVHAYFRRRIEALVAAGKNERADALCYLQLAVREWLANLSHHACFADKTPSMRIRLWKQDAQLRAVIEDNAAEFDLDAQVRHQRVHLGEQRDFPERGMGLLLLRASTDRADYTTSEAGTNRLELVVKIGRPRPALQGLNVHRVMPRLEG